MKAKINGCFYLLLVFLLLSAECHNLKAQDDCRQESVTCKNSFIQQAGRSVNIVAVSMGNGRSSFSTALFINDPGNNSRIRDNCDENNNDVVSIYVLTAFHVIDQNNNGVIDALEKELVFYINYTVANCQNTDMSIFDSYLWPYSLIIPNASVMMYSPKLDDDFVLFRFALNKSAIPESWQLYLSGIDATGRISNPCYLIHHPAGKDTKVVTTLDGHPPRHPSLFEMSNEHAHMNPYDFLVVKYWEEGLCVENGSSGAGLFSSTNYKIVGAPLSYMNYFEGYILTHFISLADIWDRYYPPYNYSFETLLDQNYDRLTPGFALYGITLGNSGISP